MDWFFIFIINALAVHRMTVLVIEDKITEPLREKLFERWSPADTWTYLFTCPWCVSIWAGTIAITGFFLFWHIWIWFALILACSTVAALIEEKR